MEDTISLQAGSPPIEKDKVVLSFLGENVSANSVVDLGFHKIDKSILDNQNVDCVKYQDINQYTFKNKGFQTIEFDDTMKKKLKKLYERSKNLTPNESPDPVRDEDESIQEDINCLEEWIKTKYTELTGEKDIIAVCSRHLIMRIAGCDENSCQIPGNPLMHLDYISFDATYKRQCDEQKQYKYKTKCPPLKNMIDVVNIWFPTDDVNDWPLGFLDTDDVHIEDYIPLQTPVGGEICSLRHKPNLKVVCKDNMKPPEVYFFRSATQGNLKKGVIHGSFRITDKTFQRKSVELRCCIFKASSNANDQSAMGTSTGGKRRKSYRQRKSKKSRKNRKKSKRTSRR